jgi:hypothetical protein
MLLPFYSSTLSVILFPTFAALAAWRFNRLLNIKDSSRFSTITPESIQSQINIVDPEPPLLPSTISCRKISAFFRWPAHGKKWDRHPANRPNLFAGPFRVREPVPFFLGRTESKGKPRQGFDPNTVRCGPRPQNCDAFPPRLPTVFPRR